MRIASLIPSGTDIASALGLADSLVARSHACDHPRAQTLPVITRSVIDTDLTPAQIDAQVTQTISAGASLYLTDRQMLNDLQPDLVLTQAICDVCAVNAATARAALPDGAQLLSLDATDFAGLWRDITRVAHAAKVPDRAQVLATHLQTRLARVEEYVRDKTRPNVLVLEWSEPPFLGGHWVPEIIARAGGVHVPSQENAPSRRASWDEISACAPDFVLLAPCGYDLDQTLDQGRDLLRDEPRFASLRASREKRVWATNATHLFSRCTPEIVRAVEIVATILHDYQGAIEEDEAQQL